MKIAIIERIKNCEKYKPFNKRYYLDNIIAVQWYPEVLKNMKLFKGFIETFF